MPKPILTGLLNWPKRKNGHILLTSTQDAMLYAQLIHDNPIKQTDLARYREETYAHLKRERAKETPNLQRMCDLAVSAQLYRECLGEVQRINDESYQVPPGAGYERA